MRNLPVRLVLASASPRRAELLRAAGFEFDIDVADVDESVRPDEDAESYVRRMAETKAATVRHRRADAAILGADTVVVVEGEILAKPSGPDDAGRMLRQLAGRTHEVLTGVCLVCSARGGATTRVARTTVEFAPMSGPEIAWYASTGEPLDKAGGYAIQGLASRFVTRIDGSYANVVGLPVSLVYQLCKDAGILVS